MSAEPKQTLYSLRRFLPVVWCALPVVVLAGLWLLVTNVLLAPSVPDENSPPDEVARFVMHEQGLPAMSREAALAFCDRQTARLAADKSFRDRFLAEVRIASMDQQRAFRSNLFDVFKPRLMSHIGTYHAMEDMDERETFIDDRIVEYNKLSTTLGDSGIGADLKVLAPSKDEALSMLLSKTTEEERAMGQAYFAAIAARVGIILINPELKAEFEARIAAPD